MDIMRDIQKTKRNYFFWALLLSVGFPAGIVMIVLGFSNGMLYVAIPGIVLVVAGFYVMPVLWSKYGSTRYYCALHQQITADNIRKVSLLSQMNGKPDKQTAADVRWLISNRYLTGFVFLDNENILSKDDAQNFDAYIAQHTRDMQTVKCPSCGADIELVSGIGACSYCGRKIAKSKTPEEKK